MRITPRSILIVATAAASLAGPALVLASPHDEGYRQSNCRDVEVTRKKHHKDDNRVAGTAIGAVAGGLIGNQVGKGKGKTIATVAGAVGGGVIGNKVQKNHQRNDTETVIERRCD